MRKFCTKFPYSRFLETEADEVGIELAAKACFKVDCSVVYFGNFDKRKNSEKKESFLTGEKNIEKKSHEWFSTHPSSENRAENLKALLPKVRLIY